jgi:hypothetical protein
MELVIGIIIGAAFIVGVVFYSAHLDYLHKKNREKKYGKRNAR